MERDEFYKALSLAHHGVPGQRWGVRRYQEKDGSLTPEGQSRYESNEARIEKRNKVLRIAGGVALGAATVATAILVGRKIYNSKASSVAKTPIKEAVKSGVIDKGKTLVDNGPIKLTLHPDTKPGVDYNAQILKNIHQMRKILSKSK